MNINELRAVISQLSVEELDSFTQWFEEFLADKWDLKIVADILTGRLNSAAQRADEDFVTGRCTPLS